MSTVSGGSKKVVMKGMTTGCLASGVVELRPHRIHLRLADPAALEDQEAPAVLAALMGQVVWAVLEDPLHRLLIHPLRDPRGRRLTPSKFHTSLL